jgi:hypothetical protein
MTTVLRSILIKEFKVINEWNRKSAQFSSKRKSGETPTELKGAISEHTESFVSAEIKRSEKC